MIFAVIWLIDFMVCFFNLFFIIFKITQEIFLKDRFFNVEKWKFLKKEQEQWKKFKKKKFHNNVIGIWFNLVIILAFNILDILVLVICLNIWGPESKIIS